MTLSTRCALRLHIVENFIKMKFSFKFALLQTNNTVLEFRCAPRTAVGEPGAKESESGSPKYIPNTSSRPPQYFLNTFPLLFPLVTCWVSQCHNVWYCAGLVSFPIKKHYKINMIWIFSLKNEKIIITEEWYANQTICAEERVHICCTQHADSIQCGGFDKESCEKVGMVF